MKKKMLVLMLLISFLASSALAGELDSYLLDPDLILYQVYGYEYNIC